ncbi:MAG: sigma 54-interacting transcriptional regulator [Polyangiales bacterium]
MLGSEDAFFRVRAADLTVRGGPDDGLEARLEIPTFVVGTGELSDLKLSDPTVSREHLRLSLEAAGVRVRDVGSRNGTWIGGVRVREALLTTSTVLTIGATSLSIHLDAGPIDLAVSQSTRFGEAIGVSPAMRRVFMLLERAARSDMTVLLEGESGVGKEILARAVHTASTRAQAPFVALDCGALSPSLIESELFGHERGAFTGAHAARHGLFEEAHGGTIFLDEIGELPLDLQPKLLRVLEEREVRPVGGRSAKPIDVRVVAATNRHLADAVEAGTFRRDLFYRLAVVLVTVPPLRDRPEDIAPLARAFLRNVLGSPEAELTEDFASMLSGYAWPGNVRELRNVIQRYALLEVRDAEALFGSTRGDKGEDLSLLPFHEARRIAMERFERAYFPKVLARAGGVVSRAAQLAEVARPSFYRMLERVRESQS